MNVSKQALDSGEIEHVGWNTPDGEAPYGYAAEHYFGPDGSDLGPDKHGVEPVFREVEGGSHEEG